MISRRACPTNPAESDRWLSALFPTDSMSQLGGDLKPGIDCPSHATYLNGVLWVEEPEKGANALTSDVSRARSYKERESDQTPDL